MKPITLDLEGFKNKGWNVVEIGGGMFELTPPACDHDRDQYNLNPVCETIRRCVDMKLEDDMDDIMDFMIERLSIAMFNDILREINNDK